MTNHARAFACQLHTSSQAILTAIITLSHVDGLDLVLTGVYGDDDILQILFIVSASFRGVSDRMYSAAEPWGSQETFWTIATDKWIFLFVYRTLFDYYSLFEPALLLLTS